MESVFADDAFRLWLSATVTWWSSQVLTPDHVVRTAMQIPALAGSGFAAWWVFDFAHAMLGDRIQRSPAAAPTKEIWLTGVALIFPMLWALNLGSALAISTLFDWPHDLLRIAINLLVAWLVIRLTSMLVRDPIWSRAIALVANTAAALNILHLLRPTLEVLDQIAIAVGELHLSALTVLKGMLALGVLLWIAVLFSKMLERHLQYLPNLTPSVRVLFAKLFKATLISLAVVVALTSTGIDLTTFAGFGGAIGLGLGFGLQKVVSNLISGVILLMDKSLKPGDIIQVGDTYGWIAALGARYVSIATRDGTEYLIPNEDIITRQVINWSHRDDLVRPKVKAQVSLQSDIAQALDLMVEAARRPARVLSQPEPKALLRGFGEKGVDLELRFWIQDAQNGVANITSEVLLNIWTLFHAHGIAVPPLKREIHLVSGSQSATAIGGVAAGHGPKSRRIFHAFRAT